VIANQVSYLDGPKSKATDEPKPGEEAF